MPRSLVEVRLLDGPNLYFPRPAAKVTLDCSGLVGLPVDSAQAVGRALGLGTTRPGPPGSVFRQRFSVRLLTRLVRRLAQAGGVSRLAVRSRTGASVTELVVAYPWRNSARAEALAYGLATVLDELSDGPAAMLGALDAAGRALADTPPGSPPRLIRPTIPVVAVTGTNGKTTTSRMIGYIAQRAGWSVGWSSTDGVYANGELVEDGDYSGPSGAGKVLGLPGVQLAVTETARGGILRRGMGVAYNDVSVVTNISADHLGLGGIDTLDQLAEVKAVITKITKPTGWCVLNADDPRTFAMRLGTKAQIWVFTTDPDSPSARVVLDGRGRVTTVLDGWVAVLAGGQDPLPVVPVVDVPMTLAGLSRVNVENVLAVTSATLALGFSVEQVATGLREFDPGTSNPGRMNLWTLPLAGGGTASVVIDLAHNEAGLEALLEIMNGIRPPGGRLLLGLGTAGDRGDDIFVRLGEIGALGADVVEIVHKTAYLRGRSAGEIGDLIAAGAARAGLQSLPQHLSEVAGLASLAGQAADGDVVAMMTHQDREQVDMWLLEHGATRDSADDVRAKVLRARAR
ncbi:MAG TPA: Mur ligase family protein [Propionibacteriaceae bacterium]|nr:Mur ligase family protein [Propionibacteriaceae bacterium]